MSLPPLDAERILRARLGNPINPVPHGRREGQDNDKVLGFSVAGGKVLALNREINAKTYIWCEPPEPPVIEGVSLRAPTINSNLNGPLARLNNRKGLQVELDTEVALKLFLDWYDSPSRGTMATSSDASSLDTEDLLQTQDARSSEKGTSPIVAGLDASIIAMRLSVENTVKGSNGQSVARTVKNKELRMSPDEFDEHVRSLIKNKDNRCALSDIPLQFHGLETDQNLLPSLDRIDSDGHYEAGNLQVVCQFINFWKSDRDNEEFKRLLTLVRGLKVTEEDG